MRDESWLQAQEYIFSLGCNISLPPKGICYRSVRIAAFAPAYLISVLRTESAIELIFCSEESCTQSTEEFNVKHGWTRSLAAAIENNSPLPTELPPNFCFGRSHTALTANQFDRLQVQLQALQPQNFQTSLASANYRDGEIYLGSIKLNEHTHTFYRRSGEDDPQQRQFHQFLYEFGAAQH